MLSFEYDDAQNINGLNVSISAKYVSADDAALVGALVAPVKAADGSAVAAGDPQTGLSLTAACFPEQLSFV